MIAVAISVTIVSTLLVVLGVERYASGLRLIDLPNDRSSHVVPRPRGGGIGVFVGVPAGLMLAAAAGLRIDTSTVVIVCAASAVALGGLWDDVSSVPPWPRLAVQFAAAGLVVFARGGLEHLPLPEPLDLPLGAAGALLAIIWIVGLTNFFNFMDGADGLAGGQAAITFSALAWVLWPLPAAVLSLLAATSVAVFLCRNWAPAKIFLGDVGSGWLGFVLATLPFAGPLDRRGDLVLLVGVSLALFLIDPVVTLVRRLAQRAPLVASHREHAYQQLYDPQGAHAPVVGGLLATAAVLSGLAIAAYDQRLSWWAGVATACLAFLVEWTIATRRRKDTKGT